MARSKLPLAVLMKWEEFCVLHGLEYATLIDVSEWLNNYSKAFGQSPAVKINYHQHHGNKKSSFLKRDYGESDSRNRNCTYCSSTTPLSIICLFDQVKHYLERCRKLKKRPHDKRKFKDCSQKNDVCKIIAVRSIIQKCIQKYGFDRKKKTQKTNNVKVEQRTLNSPDADECINPYSLSVIINQLQ